MTDLTGPYGVIRVANEKYVGYHEYMHAVSFRLKTILHIIWHLKHELIHILLGVAWVSMLHSIWQSTVFEWVGISILGSLIPDIDHLIYFFTYGRNDAYTKQIFSLLRKKEWKKVVVFIEIGHKHNTNLSFHNIYVVSTLVAMTGVLYYLDYRFLAVFVGSMVTHFLFDIGEDLALLGYINKNWTRFGPPKKYF